MRTRMPCRWHEKQIVVLENVIIDDPYTVERVRSQDKNALKRVKQVVCLSLLLLPLSLSSLLTPTLPTIARGRAKKTRNSPPVCYTGFS